MHFRKQLYVFLVGFAAYAASSTANAEILNVTIQGTVTSGGFFSNAFGVTSDGGYDGLTFTERYVVDMSRGADEQIGDPNTFGVQGGPGTGFSDGALSPILSASYTLNGVTVNLDPTAGGILVFVGTSFNQFGVFELNGSNSSFMNASLLNGDGSVPGSIGPLSYTVQASDSSAGDYVFFIGQNQFDINGTLTSLEISAAVPEPSTWAMMIIGFCGLGFLTYRRRNQASALTAA